MSPDSIDTYKSIMLELASLKAAIGRIEGQLVGFTDQRLRARDDQVACRAAVDKELDILTDKYDRLESSMTRLTTWGRALSIIGGFIITVLGVVNIILAIGGQP